MCIAKRHLADVQNGSGAGLEGSEVPCKRRGKGWHAEVVVMEECPLHELYFASRVPCTATHIHDSYLSIL